jgi:DNA-binding GntR family transcriptional regulator
MKLPLSEQAYRAIRSEILTCSIRPGQQIHQTEMVKKFEFGMTPIREALQRLTQDGLVRPIPRFGFVVTPITVDDVHELFELRIILEVAAARLAAERASDDALKTILEDARSEYEIKKNPLSYTEFLQMNIDFHCSIAIAAGNRKIAASIRTVLDELSRVFHLTLDVRDEEMQHEHIAVAKALQDRDPDQVEHLTKTQITRSKEKILDRLLGLSGVGQGLILDAESRVA